MTPHLISAKRKTTVVNKYKEPYDVYIGRGSPFGNPYSVKQYGREICINMYKIRFLRYIKDEDFRKLVFELKGKTLGCYCKPKKCHGDIIVEWLEASNG